MFLHRKPGISYAGRRKTGGGGRFGGGALRNEGMNPPNGVVMNFYMKDVNRQYSAKLSVTADGQEQERLSKHFLALLQKIIRVEVNKRHEPV